MDDYLVLGSVVKLDFEVRDENDSLVKNLPGLDVKIWTVNMQNGQLIDLIDEVQATLRYEEEQPLDGYYRAILDTGRSGYAANVTYAAQSTIPYITGGNVITARTFILRQSNTVQI